MPCSVFTFYRLSFFGFYGTEIWLSESLALGLVAIMIWPVLNCAPLSIATVCGTNYSIDAEASFGLSFGTWVWFTGSVAFDWFYYTNLLELSFSFPDDSWIFDWPAPLTWALISWLVLDSTSFRCIAGMPGVLGLDALFSGIITLIEFDY